MDLKWYLEWYNLIFILPFVAGIIYLLFSIVGGSSDHDVGHDHDISSDHDVSHDHGTNSHVHMDAYPDTHIHSDHDNDFKFLSKVLDLLGIGKTPLSIIILSLFTLWAFFGFCANMVSMEKFGMVYPLISVAIAFFGMIIFNYLLVRFLAKFVPTSESHGSSYQDLIGNEAQALYTITKDSGMITLYDKHKNYQQMPCVLSPDSSDTKVEPNENVKILSYDAEKKAFIVIKNDKQY
jgi:membrane protein implicated in regulation of membrane protease activity